VIGGVFMSNKEPKVIGIGGILFKSKNPDKTKKWYQENLGLPTYSQRRKGAIYSETYFNF